MHLRAIMPIKKGEEVTITYGDMLESRDQRREFLLKSSKFNCDCSACASWTPESDQHRMMIKAIRRNIKPSSFDDSKLLAWVEDPTKPDDLIVAECHSVLSLYDAEQCYPDRTWNIWYQNNIWISFIFICSLTPAVLSMQRRRYKVPCRQSETRNPKWTSADMELNMYSGLTLYI